MISAIVALASGCASTSDVENLQSQIDSLKPVVASAEQHAADAHKVAASAEQHAIAAHAAADKAAQACVDMNSKLDKLFKKSQFK